MRRSLKSKNRQSGYVLLTLLLALALVMIGLLAVMPRVKQQILRDREDEMRHRGTAYMRAIQHFYKKFGRYPSRIEELENTNNVRFLRKRYKDPMSVDHATGKEKDFKFLHQQDVSLNNGPILGQIPGQALLGQQGLAMGQAGQQALSQFGGAQGAAAALGALQAQGGLGGIGGAQQTAASQNNLNGDASNPDADANSNSSGSPSSSGPGSNSLSGSSPGSSSGFNGPTLGGGPILGVASTSKAKSIRVFFDKSHYNDWLFIYLQQADRGGLLVGPVNPGMPTGGGLGAGFSTPGAGGAAAGQGFGLGGSSNGLQSPQSSTPTPQSPTSPQSQP